MSITALPTPPTRSDPSTFAARGDAFMSALPTFATEANALAVTVNADKVLAAASASSASTSATTATNAANSAVAVSGATLWVSGTTYTAGQCVWSPSNFQTYRRKTNGAGTTDPSADGTNWASLASGIVWEKITTNTSAVAGKGYLIDTTAGDVVLALPTSPQQGDTVSWRDAAGTFAPGHRAAFDPGASNRILGGTLAEICYLSTANLSGEWVFDNATNGWRL